MATRTVSYGKCFLCGVKVAKNAASRHLAKCVPAHDSPGGKTARLFHLRVEGAHAPGYWMHIEMPASATLDDLDGFLRSIWLECCGHLSAFTIGGVTYERDTGMVDAMWKDIFGPGERTSSMRKKLSDVLSPGAVFTHEYDYGTTTELKLKVIGEREGPAPKDKARLLARNYAPDIRCSKCDQRAEWVYVYGYPFEPYCAVHAEEIGEERPLPIVNSPRVGECGYEGPFDESLWFEETAPTLP